MSQILKKYLTVFLTLTTVVWSLGPIAPLSPINEAQASAGDITVYTVNGGANNISAFTMNAGTGALTAIAPGTFATGGGSAPDALAITPAGTFLYSVNQDTGAVRGFSIDATTGALTSLNPAYSVGSSPTQVAITPSGSFLYVALSGFRLMSASRCFAALSTSLLSTCNPVRR